MTKSKPKRIGIYAGSFNPVHAGHVAFALQAIKAAELDAVYFVPERQPRDTQGSEHFGHRVAMLTRALKPHARCKVLELVDVNLTVQRTLPKLQQEFAGAELVFLLGSDVAAGLPEWPGADQFLKRGELVIGLRDARQHEQLKTAIAS